VVLVRAVVQRCAYGSVSVGGRHVSECGPGLVVFLGVGQNDQEEDARYLADKIANLRIFEDEEGKMNLSVKDVGGQILAVSQFTLYGDCIKGRRPSFSKAAPPEKARDLYRLFIEELEKRELTVKEGIFQEHMLVRIENDGPVTILLESSKLF